MARSDHAHFCFMHFGGPVSLIIFTLTITLSCKITVIKTATGLSVLIILMSTLCAKTLSRSDNSAV